MSSTRYILLLGLFLMACSSKGTSSNGTDAGGAPPASSLTDRLARGELAEGKERAFGLPLPLNIKISARFQDEVHLLVDAVPEDVANYVRARVKAGKMVVGASSTVFEKVVPIADPSKQVSVEIQKAALVTNYRSKMVVRNATPLPPPSPSETPDEIMRKAGLTPDGKLLDPKHMQ